MHKFADVGSDIYHQIFSYENSLWYKLGHRLGEVALGHRTQTFTQFLIWKILLAVGTGLQQVESRRRHAC